MLSHTILTLALASASSAHFVLNWPPTAGFDDDAEGNSPCGGATVVVNSSSPQIQVDRFAVQIFSSHPAGDWTFRGTLDTQEPYNWTDLTREVSTVGSGDFCLDYMYAPDDFAGKAGIIQVIDDSADGTLYQCAAVNFVSGANSTLGETCTNKTSSFTATWSTQEEGNSTASASSSGMASMTASSTASATAKTSSAAAAVMTMGAGAALVAGLGAVAAGFVL